MKQRISLACSASALVIATLGSTPLGEAARHAVSQAVPRNSVGALQLKRNAVTSSKIAPNAIRTGQILDGSLLASDFKPGQIPQGPKGDKGDKGDRGATGTAGQAGPQGLRGPSGTSGWQSVAERRRVPKEGTVQVWDVACPAGKKVLGGGVTMERKAGTSGFRVIQSGPTGQGAGWEATAVNSGSSADVSAAVWAICAFVTS
jgi:hypothetical protein